MEVLGQVCLLFKKGLNVNVLDTVELATKAGANVIVSGSAIFKHPQEKHREIIDTLRNSVQNNSRLWPTK